MKKPRPPRGSVKELKYYGTAACEALFRHRRNDIVRVYIEERLIPSFSALLKWAAAARKAYHVVGPEELERLTASIHHQGICVLARERPQTSFDQMLELVERGPQLLVYLDGVENPHNLGAIVRSCAHFGAKFVLGPQGVLPRLSPAACRVAEGGAEAVQAVELQRVTAQLGQLKSRGFRIVCAAAAEGQSIHEALLPGRTVLVLGAEVEGLSEPVRRLADLLVTIPGSGAVESLNVSVAFGILAAAYARQHGVA